MAAEEEISLAARLDFQPGQIVQEIGYGEDVDQELRDSIAEVTGVDLVDEDHADVVDTVLLWFRDEDGDLTDALVDAQSALPAGRVIWLLTPKAGRDGYVEPSDIGEAAQTAGLSPTSRRSAAADWSGSRLLASKR
ncbi:DUF3052 domain-containing protein [Streptomyces sp. NBC_01565]|uniref:DUF3052 domain-containing protein n=1 Tax=unclassified Streptomyces TaxID=2593676 RepID=UPI002254DA9D|nr:DUF3052 domain-containing protein [Streptomyces sp. NBC_01565]MCX4539248.1 DUF3052 domain-containing protein [Streptomyces sp. NBC_01565]